MLKLEKFDDRHLLQIAPLQPEHLPEIQALWRRQYARRVETCGCLPSAWLDNPALFSRFVAQRLIGNSSIVVLLHGKAIGFLTYDRFDFHAEPSAFFPILAHAAEEAYQLTLYRLMYTYVSQRLVAQGCLNHFFTFFAQDQQLQACLFELGFGLYAVDAYRDLSPILLEALPGDIQVRPAELTDVESLWVLVQESDAYYAEPPLFLKRTGVDKAELIELVAASPAGQARGAVFLAVKDEAVIGFLNIRGNPVEDGMTLSDRTTGCLDPLGAYIQKEYRGQGIGRALLAHALVWGRQQAFAQIHVDFESANAHANQFWPKYFTPSLYSVKRRLNNDLL